MRSIRSRHILFVAAFLAVFVAGWYLGQPVWPECGQHAPAGIEEPGTVDLLPDYKMTVTAASLCEGDGPSPRILAWFGIWGVG
ncbi:MULTISPECIES: hypothetical protein [unclassified Streptomyces]|uniref:hypothetical protein n=1 Tax=unclassified Streptomyces TaxID=2593676 RepID=UPI002E809ABF|nr:hypothetical protein [Streptomyces sp. NBC_00562]WTC76961.1 hypothetical protein OH719_02680 [Streptomyces sp. NBC_01653]WTD93899.1 hypothetical protein OG891_44175 [Streptomyces sp. NBC_01637]WUC24921.1 hypothetical protein OHA33_42810 [Streptomyces sp. NBC_00562]